MKMAKASDADIAMAFELSQFVEELVDGYCPKQACEEPESDEIEWLDDDLDQLKRVIGALTNIARKGSIFRVVGGMGVVCDPVNELLDPEADTLEIHPRFERLHAANVDLLAALKLYESAREEMFVQCCSNPVFDSWGKPVSMEKLNEAHFSGQAAIAKHGATS